MGNANSFQNKAPMASVFTEIRGWSAQTQFTGSASFKQKLTQIQAELDFSQNTKVLAFFKSNNFREDKFLKFNLDF